MHRLRRRIRGLNLLAILLGCLVSILAGADAASQAAPAESALQAREKIVELFQKARLAEQRRDFEEAARLYNSILQRDPRLAEIWTNKGLALYELSKYREALLAFSRAAELKRKLLTPHLFLGIVYLKLGEPQKALEPLLAALALEPDHPQVNYELANAYSELGQFEKAVQLYRELGRRDPKMEQAWYKLGIAYLNWSKSAARKLVASSPPSVYRELLLADLLAVGGVLRDAEAHYRAAVEAQPNLLEARLAFGRFYLDQPEGPAGLAAARAQFEKARALAPNDPRCTMAMVRLSLFEEKYPEALAGLETILLADPAFARTHLSELLVGFSDPRKVIASVCDGERQETNRPECAGRSAAAAALAYAAHLELGETRQAERALRNLEEQLRGSGPAAEPTPLQSYSRRLQKLQRDRDSRHLSPQEQTDLARYAYHLGKYHEALRVLNNLSSEEARYWLSLTCRALARESFLAAIAANPDSYRTHLLLADLANDRHNTPEAIAEYEKALALGADDPEVHLLLVQFLASKGKDEDATTRARVAVVKFPNHSLLNCELGKLLLKAKAPEEAQRHFQKALEADPSLAAARAGLADTYGALGDTERAIQEMKQALDSDPDGSLHYRLGRWYQKLGQTREASEAFATSSELKQKRSLWERERFSALP